MIPISKGPRTWIFGFFNLLIKFWRMELLDNNFEGGAFSCPQWLKTPLTSGLQKSYCTTPPYSAFGTLTTRSPSLTSFLADRFDIPPPMPTSKLKLMDLNVRYMLSVTPAAQVTPILPAGRHAITTLWCPISPTMYTLLSFSGKYWEIPCTLVNMVVATLNFSCMAQIYPIVYSPFPGSDSMLDDRC